MHAPAACLTPPPRASPFPRPPAQVLNHLQVGLLARYRAGDTEERTLRAIHLSVNGIASGLRNSG